MNYIVTTSPHLHDADGVAVLMRRVLYALLPGVLLQMWFFGWGVLLNIALSVATAWTVEALMLWARQRPLQPFLSDYSAVLTACLFAVALPPFLPWWMPVLGMVFAIIFAKQLYGGLGHNPFNPAMVGYAILLISFPAEMTRWPYPVYLMPETLNFWHSVQWSFMGTLSHSSVVSIDALTGATPLDALKTGLAQNESIRTLRMQPLFDTWVAVGWQWVNVAYLLGGMWLLYKRVIYWPIPVGFLLGLVSLSSLFFMMDSGRYVDPIFHLFTGATMLGVFFIATDPVTAATSPRARFVYGLGIGVLVYVIRTWGGYPDGVAFAVLFMNLTAPALDVWLKPRPFGR
ncbi:electron transport complex subunit RsxD [Thioflexithrix psekupsensis]|uniref:Ion-translocating oxidoreductase complex subunit D n=2 Tax=Thioflexithrix psekupsensis TaxID=1570016 RepID=A0A251X6I8_9GAMM|nr:electron transport complex subunit RsxD [Thioflexithrix psekupsensis]